VPPAVERNGGACQCRDQYCPRHRSWHSGALAELEALKAGVRCTVCGTTRPQAVIDCPVCDVPSGHVHGGSALRRENDRLRAEIVEAVDEIQGMHVEAGIQRLLNALESPDASTTTDQTGEETA
jgi:hypothetical protein